MPQCQLKSGGKGKARSRQLDHVRGRREVPWRVGKSYTRSLSSVSSFTSGHGRGFGGSSGQLFVVARKWRGEIRISFTGIFPPFYTFLHIFVLTTLCCHLPIIICFYGMKRMRKTKRKHSYSADPVTGWPRWRRSTAMMYRLLARFFEQSQ